jgi:hypothetical protein
MTNDFKTLTSENWLMPDPTSVVFVKLSHQDGKISTMTGEEWLGLFLDPRLSMSVPENVRALFEVARGSLAYGYFFYPLYTLACEQLFRVAETAVSEKCKMMGAPKKVRTFEHKVQFLLDNQALSAEDKLEWDAVRLFRNSTSHPNRQHILPPGAVASLLFSIGQKINALFI